MDAIESYVAEVLARIPRPFPERGRIAEDLRAHLLEAGSAGENPASVVARMGSPDNVARDYLAASPRELASVKRRAVALLLDYLVTLGLFLLPFGLLFARVPVSTEQPGALEITALVVFLGAVTLVSVVYFPLLEKLYGQTLGKRALGICVTRDTGEAIGWGAAFLRRLPFYFHFFWLDALVAPFSARRQRAFDMVAKTIVVRCEQARELAAPAPG